jgi:hypothetical protein
MQRSIRSCKEAAELNVISVRRPLRLPLGVGNRGRSLEERVKVVKKQFSPLVAARCCGLGSTNCDKVVP